MKNANISWAHVIWLLIVLRKLALLSTVWLEVMRTHRDEKSFFAKRFELTRLYYLPGTKTFHHFTPISTNAIGVKRVSTDQEFEFTFNFKTGQYRVENKIMSSPAQPTISISGGEYLVCMCEGKHRVGVVMLVDDE